MEGTDQSIQDIGSGTEEKANTKTTINDINAFLKENYNEKIHLLTKSNYHLLPRPLLVFFDQYKFGKLSELKECIDEAYKIVEDFANTLHFALLDFENAALFHLTWNDFNNMGYNERLPFVFGIDKDDRQHQMDSILMPSELLEFCEDLEKNKLYYSEPIPAPDEQNPDMNVQFIVADNFRELVEQNDKDVFVTLHSKYSIRYEANLWDVPSKLKDDSDSLVFYAICVYTNYIPLEYYNALEYRVADLPTSFLIPRSDKTRRIRYVHKCCGGPEIMRFIAKNTSTQLKTVDRKGRYKHRRDSDSCKDAQPAKSKVDDLTVRLNRIADKSRLPTKLNDDGFLKFLDSILHKVNENERKDIEMELVSLALSRSNKIS